MPIDDEHPLASTRTPGDGGQPRGPHDPPDPSSTGGHVDRKRRDQPLEDEIRRYGREQVLARVPRHIAPVTEPAAPPPNYRPLSPAVVRQISLEVQASPTSPLVFDPSNGACIGNIGDVRYRLRGFVDSEQTFNAYGEPSAEERLEALEAGRPAPAPVPRPSPSDIERTVEERLSRLVTASADQIKDDVRYLERVRWSPGRAVRLVTDDELPELEPLPELRCPSCDGTAVAVRGLSQPPAGDCLTEGCRFHFRLRKQTDDFGRSFYTVSKPEPPHGREGFVGIGGANSSRIL